MFETRSFGAHAALPSAASRAHALTAWVALAFATATAPAFGQQHAGQYDVADIEYGAQLFNGRCVQCHGERGDLMPQANLRSGRFRNASSDRDLMRVIREGVPGTAMVAQGYADAELMALVAYLRNITTYDASAGNLVLGDPERGKALFEGEGRCLTCHRVGTEGQGTAPPLTEVGTKRTAATLRRTLIDPQEALLPINRPVRAVTQDGTVIRGRRLNEDTFSVQLFTEDGRLVSLDKTRLRAYTIGTESAMPAYGDVFDEREIADLLAYLLSLKGLDQ